MTSSNHPKTIRIKIRRVITMADRLQQDINARKLGPGDPYLSTADAAKMLSVSTGVANKALQLLAKRNVITRRQGAGTFITAHRSHAMPQALHAVHMGMSWNRTAESVATEVLLGLQATLKGVQIRVHSPSSERDEYLEQTIADALKSRGDEGFILAGSQLSSQRILANSGLPGVVFGHTYASTSRLASLDLDQDQAGRILTKHLLDHGHRRILMLTHALLYPGDLVMMDAVRDVIAQAGLPESALVVRSLPEDWSEVKESIRPFIEGVQEIPGILARRKMGEAAMELAKSLGVQVPSDLRIVSPDYHYFRDEPAPFPVLCPTWTFRQMGEELGRILDASAQGRRLDPLARRIPVKLELPSEEQ